MLTRTGRSIPLISNTTARVISSTRNKSITSLQPPCSILNIRMSSSTSTTNTNTTTTPPPREWLVHIPDFPNSLDKRLAVRQNHLTNVKPDIDSGKVVMGGALLSKQPDQGEAPDMIGSAMLIRADSEEEVREWMAKDVYTKGGAWDVANAKIYPFRCAVRTGM